MTETEKGIVELALAIIARDLKEPGAAMTNPTLVKNYLLLERQNLEHEEFGVLFFDTQTRLIEKKVFSIGCIDSAAVYPRQIVKHALKINAASLSLFHNHPSGVLDASNADIRITKRLQEALDLVEIPVRDHFIVGKGEVMSFCERGLL